MCISARFLAHLHNWTHCFGRLFLSAEARLNRQPATDSSPAEVRGPIPEKCTLSAVTMKDLHIVQMDVGGPVSRWSSDVCLLVGLCSRAFLNSDVHAQDQDHHRQEFLHFPVIVIAQRKIPK